MTSSPPPPAESVTHTQRVPFFIFGCPRSGTSLLSRMIDAHPHIAIPFESHIYNTFHPWLKHYGNLRSRRAREYLVDDILESTGVLKWDTRPTRDEILSLLRRPDFNGIVKATMDAYAVKRGSRRWGEKTPAYIGWWREILKAFPEMQVIHMVRDPRDVAISLCKARFGPAHVLPAAKRWRSYVRQVEYMRAELPADNFLQVRYEDLLKNPETTLRSICQFLGESYSPRMLSFHERKQNYSTDARNLANLNRPLMTDNAQKWRKTLTRREVRLIEGAAGQALSRYGYEAATQNPFISPIESFCCKWIEQPPRRISKMLRNSQGLVRSLRTLTLYTRLRLRRESSKVRTDHPIRTPQSAADRT